MSNNIKKSVGRPALGSLKKQFLPINIGDKNKKLLEKIKHSNNLKSYDETLSLILSTFLKDYEIK
jgi:hypothetical protein